MFRSTQHLYHFLTKNPRIVPVLVLVILPIFVSSIYHLLPNVLPKVLLFSNEKNFTSSFSYEKIQKNAEDEKIILPYHLITIKPEEASLHLIKHGVWNIKYDVSLRILSIPFVILFLLYALYPPRYHSDKGLKGLVIKYELVKKILYVTIPLLVFVTSLLYIHAVPATTTTDTSLVHRIISHATLILQYSVTAGILWILSQMSRKEFRYYLARAYIKSIPDNCERDRKLVSLIMALNSYNKYLLRTVKLQIDNLKLYSTLVVESNMKMSDSIYKSFDHTDKLMPAERLLGIMSEIMRIDKNEHFMVRQTFVSKLTMWGTLAGTILPVVTSVTTYVCVVVKICSSLQLH